MLYFRTVYNKNTHLYVTWLLVIDLKFSFITLIKHLFRQPIFCSCTQTMIDTVNGCMAIRVKRGTFLNSTAPSPWDCSKHFTLQPLADQCHLNFSEKHSELSYTSIRSSTSTRSYMYTSRTFALTHHIILNTMTS